MLQSLANIDYSRADAPVFVGILILSYALLVLVALPVHEWAHAFAAYKLGDETAKWNGRLTLNPLKHLDLIGTVMLVLCGVGYAKPVPVNPYYFNNSKRGMALTSLAGPLANFTMAFAAMVLSSVLYAVFGVTHFMAVSILALVLEIFANINISLTVFNLLPIPPLDGSNIFAAFLPDKWNYTVQRYQQYITAGLFALLLLGALNVPLALLQDGFRAVINFLVGLLLGPLGL